MEQNETEKLRKKTLQRLISAEETYEQVYSHFWEVSTQLANLAKLCETARIERNNARREYDSLM